MKKLLEIQIGILTARYVVNLSMEMKKEYNPTEDLFTVLDVGEYTPQVDHDPTT